MIKSQTKANDFDEQDERPYLGGCSIVRELHVYGSVVPVSVKDPTKFQHQGFGMLLMEEAERIAREEHGSSKIAVISGRKFGPSKTFDSKKIETFQSSVNLIERSSKILQSRRFMYDTSMKRLAALNTTPLTLFSLF